VFAHKWQEGEGTVASLRTGLARDPAALLAQVEREEREDRKRFGSG
jgi:hypothetical protein